MKTKNTAAVSSQQFEEMELIKKSRNGDTAAFSELVAPYSKRIYNIGLKMLNNREDAADMAQDVLLKIFRNLNRFRGDAAFSTWVYRISVNTCRDILRSSYRQHERLFTDFGEENEQPEYEVADYSALPEQLYEDRESNAYLLALIRGLTPKYRIVMVLREVSGLSYQEIADAVNISVGTVKSRLNRARAAMREKALADAEHNPQLARLINCQ
ncbi:MAG: sigma-70 family RNA polymerase sigma factor [Firmicutes bacterium]|nr:sigma-70 family RNA polymerase sigma factor [Bacillota bacterium]